jgi:cytochrome c-type biogenesis protein CcmH/NrfG
MQVLNKHPEHEGALLLMGMGAFRSGDYAGALVFLPRLKQVHLARTGGSKAVKRLKKLTKPLRLPNKVVKSHCCPKRVFKSRLS